MNTLHSSQTTDDKRQAEIAEMLAASVIRMPSRKSSSLFEPHARPGELQSTRDEATCPAAGVGRRS
jgi:hypothetical protein